MKLFETRKHQHTATETVNIFKEQSPGHYKVFLHSTPDDFFWKLLAAKFGEGMAPGSLKSDNGFLLKYRICLETICYTKSATTLVFTARRYASAVYAVVVCPFVCLSVCHKPVFGDNGACCIIVKSDVIGLCKFRSLITWSTQLHKLHHARIIIIIITRIPIHKISLSYDNAKVTTNLRRSSNLQNILRLSYNKLTI